MLNRYDRVGRGRRRRRVFVWIILAAVLAGLTYLTLGWRVGALLSAGQEQLLDDHIDAARDSFRGAAFYRLHRGRVLEARGIAELFVGNNSEAESLLGRARTAGTAASGLDLAAVSRRLADTGNYDALEALVRHRQQSGGREIESLWRAESNLALGRLAAAAALLDQEVPAGGTDDAIRHERLQQLTRRRQAAGEAFSIVDRRGRPIYGHTVADSAPVLEVPELATVLEGPGGLLEALDPRDLRGQVSLTLDLVYQKAAHAALGRFAGAFVALDPRTGAILALVNHAGNGDTAVASYRRQFEPGSIIKMITLAAALDAGLDMERMFPLNCTGNMSLDSKAFYDWTRHDSVADVDAATAVSCNLAFAAMGLEIGQARLDDSLKRFGFGVNLTDTDLELDLGRLADMDSQAPRFDLASRSVGLRNVSITAVHTALISAAFAHGGTIMRPHLIASRRGLGSETPYFQAQPEPLLQPTSEATAALVAQAMVQVVESAKGTGRRAAVPGLSFAMKTGTAGERPLNSVIFGFAPLASPEVAFGFIAEHAGKAELEGARIVRDFLATVRNEFGQNP